jgi:hypothetical protein
VEWGPSRPHCQVVPGVWNAVTRAQEDGSRRRFVQILAESTLDIFMTEDNLVILETVRTGKHISSIDTHPENTVLEGQP